MTLRIKKKLRVKQQQSLVEEEVEEGEKEEVK